MILTGDQIRREVSSGRIVIEPFTETQVNPNSYNYRLGTHYIALRGDAVIDIEAPPEFPDPVAIPESGLLLEPSCLYLANTAERIGSDEYITSLIGKSSMGRLGLFLQISADLGHQGHIHQWTLELRCSKRITIYPGMLIGQVSFWVVSGSPRPSLGYYARCDVPTPSRCAK